MENNGIERSKKTWDLLIDKKKPFVDELLRIIIEDNDNGIDEEYFNEMRKAFGEIYQHLIISSATITDDVIHIHEDKNTSGEIREEIYEALHTYQENFLGQDTITDDEEDQKELYYDYTVKSKEKIQWALETLGINLQSKYFIFQNQTESYTIMPILRVEDLAKVFRFIKMLTTEEENKWINCLLRCLYTQLIWDDEDLILYKQILGNIKEYMQEIDHIERESRSDNKQDNDEIWEEVIDRENLLQVKKGFRFIKENRWKEFKFLEGLWFSIDIEEEEDMRYIYRMPEFTDKLYESCFILDKEKTESERNIELCIAINSVEKTVQEAIKYIKTIKWKGRLFWQAKKEIMTGIHQSILYIQETKVLANHQKRIYKETLLNYYTLAWDM